MTDFGSDDAQTQEKVFAFLSNPASHAKVQRIDTHAASVFLEGGRALKIKHAVRFPFLDYSTLDKRKAACEEEIRINRRFAPQIYRRVVAVTRAANDTLAIDGAGKPVEYAVEMARFDERQTLDHLARAGELNRDLVDAIADAIVSAHHDAPHVAVQSWLQSIPKIIADNSAALRKAASFVADDIDELDAASNATFARLQPLLEQRGTRGFVRRCHGDLHLANIVVIDDKPVLFDAIEFDETIASTDVLYDLAFPLMDLLHYGQRKAANTLLNRYLSKMPAETLDALAALPLLLSIRAAIRAHVLLARASSASCEEARAYFELARTLIHPAPPTLVAIGGLSGTGKSVAARAIASHVPPEPGAVVLRSDIRRKQMFGVPAEDKLDETAYQPDVTRRVYEALAQQARHVLSRGHSVIVDAVFARESERAAIADVARQAGLRFVGLFLVADLRTRQARISQRAGDASDATVEIARRQEEYDIGAMDWAVLDASGTPEQTLQSCVQRVDLDQNEQSA